MVGVLGASGTARAAVPAIETFDNDAAGWTGNTTSATVVHVAGGGNPDGHIQSRKDLSPPVFDIDNFGIAVPEPGTLLLLALGTLMVCLVRPFVGAPLTRGAATR